MLIDNAYYFSAIQPIGGIETFLYQLVKTNQDKNIVIYYKSCDLKQLKRLNKYCTLKQYSKGTKICAKKCFFNFNLDPLENGDVEADEKILIVHGNYKWLECKPPMHKDITDVYAVSKDSANAYAELTGIPCKVVYNPISVDDKKVLMLMSATRLDTRTENIKGSSRMITLANALDKYCEEHDVDYQWHVYSTKGKTLEQEHIQVLNPTLEIANYMHRYDYVIQLSDNVEGYNYTVHEALNRSVPIVATPCDTYKECKVTDDMAIWLDFDCSNVDQVVQEMFTRVLDFKYTSPKSNWGNLLVKPTKKVEVTKIKMIKVKANTTSQDKGIKIGELGRIAMPGEIFEIPEDRLVVLLGDNAFKYKFVDVVKDEPIEEEPVKATLEDKPKKAARKKKQD